MKKISFFRKGERNDSLPKNAGFEPMVKGRVVTGERIGELGHIHTSKRECQRRVLTLFLITITFWMVGSFSEAKVESLPLDEAIHDLHDLGSHDLGSHDLNSVNPEPLRSDLDTLSQDSSSQGYLVAQRKSKRAKRYKNRKGRGVQRRLAKAKSSRTDISSRDLADGLRLAKEGNYQEASIKLFQLSHRPRYKKQRLQIKYILGLMFYQMELNQLSAFQFISVVKKGKGRYLKQSLEKLSLAADALGDDSYSIMLLQK